ncbi:DUF6268 family outer membrane beta-barrel protein [Christiangramia sabulilitoris]|uniref:DUF6268 domain-containing protein n=1 Tax=Christiangramia sabulilitoris TaxID=2583991 RepID=A0A550I5Y3_9FLAO|nr:DUF6268 family outer membrane beta-barrel protein [Christiangramia sabulilitoris]TRO66395.1 hypothetical protein FGM01_00485 [Christiangramia sabulilitoris]
MKFSTLFLIITMTAFSMHSLGQSFFDVGNLSYENVNYRPGSEQNYNVVKFSARLNYGHQIKNEDYLLVFYSGEIFKFQDISIAGDDLDLYANFIGAGYLHFWKNKKWSLLTQVRFKFNSDEFNPLIKYAQTGGWFLLTNKRSEKLNFFAGMYFNQEVEKTLIFPIGGLHWIPNNKWNLYVLIPSNIRFEYILKKECWYTGIESDWTLNSYRVHKNPGIYYFRKETLNTSVFIEKQFSKSIVIFGKIGNYQLNDFEAYDLQNNLIPNSSLDSNLIDNLSLQVGMAFRLRD